MRKKYIIYATVIFIEFEVLGRLNELGKFEDTIFSKLIRLVIILIPILMLLNTICNDEKFKDSTKIVSKYIFWLIIICSILGILMDILESFNIL